MTSHLRRRATVAAALLMSTASLSALAGAPTVRAADADPVKVTYDCAAPGIGTQPLDFTLSTNLRASMYVGTTVTPVLRVRVTIPGFALALARLAGVYYADASGTMTVLANGRKLQGKATFPYTELPTGNDDFPVDLPATLPKLTPTRAGTITYTPGPIDASLNGYDNHANKAEAKKIGTVDANCVVKSTGKVIDRITVVKSPTTVSTSATYAKAAKKVTAVATVAAKSGVRAYGKVTSVLYRGKTKVRTLTATLVRGKATTRFAGVKKKGAYKVVTRYAGSGAHKASTSTRFFTIR